MTSSDHEVSPEKSVLEDLTINYEKLGFRRNPFDGIPVFSDQESPPANGYLRYYLGRLSSAINNAVASRPACVYISGPPGSGKSAILKALSQMPRPRGTIYPIYLRFPLSGGRLALYNELTRRLPRSLLKLLFFYAKAHYAEMAKTYVGRKLFWAASSQSLHKALEQIKISPQYAVESISAILEIVLELADCNRVVLILDEFEHAWSRFTGAQKYKWEESMVNLFEQLGPRLVVVLPILPGSFEPNSRPYMNFYNWKGIDLNLILNVTQRNMVEINCSTVTIKNAMYSTMRREMVNNQGKRTCRTLLEKSGNYETVGEAMIDLRGRLLMMVCEGRDWTVGKGCGTN